PHLAAKPVLGERWRKGDAGPCLTQRGFHLLGIVSDGRYDAEARHYDSSHAALLVDWWRGCSGIRARVPEGGAAISGRLLFRESDFQVCSRVNLLAVRLEPAIGNAKHQPAAHDALEIHAIFHLLHGRRHHALELHLSGGKRHAFPFLAEPAKEEARPLPQRVKTEATGHYGNTDEVAGEEPQVRLYVELGANEALVEGPAGFADFRDAVEHQHGRGGQLRIARPEQLAASAGKQFFIAVARFPIRHKFLASVGWDR